MADVGQGAHGLGRSEVNADLLKAAKRALATLLALGHREEGNNVIAALRRAIDAVGAP